MVNEVVLAISNAIERKNYSMSSISTFPLFFSHVRHRQCIKAAKIITEN